MLFYRADCRHFTGEKPCAPHKSEGVVCFECPRYEPVKDRILIIKLDAAGDVLRSTSILPAFKKNNESLSIWWITENSSKPLLDKNPFIDVLLGVDPALPGILSSVSFERAFNFDMSRKAAGILAMAQSRVKKGFGLSKEGSVVPLEKEAEEWFEMGIFDSVKRANQRTYQDHLFQLGGLTYGGGSAPALFDGQGNRVGGPVREEKQAIPVQKDGGAQHRLRGPMAHEALAP